MSHEITNIDRQQGRAIAWHNLTEVIANLSLADNWLTKWEAVKTPLYRIAADGSAKKTDACIFTASDNPEVTIGKAFDCDTYSPIYNADFLRIVGEAMLSIAGSQVESVGSVCGRTRTFITLRLKELEEFEAAGRKFTPFLNFLNSFDGSAPFTVISSNVCTVCNNTFSSNLRATGKQRSGIEAAKKASRDGHVSVRLKHTKNVALRLENVSEIIDGFLGAQMQFRAIMNALHDKPIAKPIARNFFAGLLANGEKRDEISTRQENQVDRLVSLFTNGRGNKGETRADAFSAVTEYATHESAGQSDNAQKQFVSSEFGSGARLKSRAFNALQDESEIASLVTVGEHNLAQVG